MIGDSVDTETHQMHRECLQKFQLVQVGYLSTFDSRVQRAPIAHFQLKKDLKTWPNLRFCKLVGLKKLEHSDFQQNKTFELSELKNFLIEYRYTTNNVANRPKSLNQCDKGR